MAYRNKTYVAFDGDADIRYYYLMKAWRLNDGHDFNFFDAHELRQARDTSSEETIKNSLRVRLNNSKRFILLVGESTRYLYKFVRWELEIAVKLQLPIIVVNLNGLRHVDVNRCPPIARDNLSIHLSFSQKIINYAMTYWPEEHRRRIMGGDVGGYYYTDDVYRKVGAL